MKKTFLAFIIILASFSVFAETPTKELNLNGDFRYRHEYVSQESPPAGSLSSSYHQQRIRARLGLKPVINDVTTTEFRLATGSGRTSTNQTLGASSSAFANYTVTLDRAGFKFSPTNFFSLMGGRLGNLYFEAGNSDLIWDSDLNFDGMAFAFDRSAKSFELFLNCSYYWVDKSTTSASRDVVMMSTQFGARHSFEEDVAVSAAVAVHHLSNLQGHSQISSSNAPAGNSVVVGSSATQKYATSFNLINPGAEFQTKVSRMPFVLFVDYVLNTGASIDNTGYLVGFKANQIKNRGDFGVLYDYRLLKRDSAVASFTDADSFGGGTNGKSHRVSLSYQVAQNFTVALTGYLGQAGISDAEKQVRRNKIHVDLIFKF